jgi:hypothetical protein
MISFLSSAKPFIHRDGENQRQALKSWLSVSPEVEVILYGDAQGVDEVCHDIGINHVINIKSTPTGVPYFNAIADHAKQYARHETQVYLNCDILMSDSLLKAVERVTFKKYLMIGQRIDLHKDTEFATDKSNWIDQLIQLEKSKKISLHPPSGKDYFVFPRGLWDGIPPLIVGRIGYDCGLLEFCLERQIPVIDATYDILSIHQFHEYNHLPGGLKEYQFGSDVEFNGRLLMSTHSSPHISDATWTLRSGRMEKSYARGDRLRYMELVARYKLKTMTGSFVLRAIWRILRALRIYNIHKMEIGEVLHAYSVLAAEGKQTDLK